MSNLYFNIRFGARHFQWARDRPYFSFKVNSHWIENKPTKWFAVYCLFGKQVFLDND